MVLLGIPIDLKKLLMRKELCPTEIASYCDNTMSLQFNSLVLCSPNTVWCVLMCHNWFK